MRRLALLSLLCVVVLATAAAAAGKESGSRLPTSGTVWAVERFDGGQNTLAAFDASTGDVLGVVPIGRRPIGVTAPHGTGRVYTADERSNQLSVLSKADFSIVAQIPTGAASFPHHIMATPNGKFVYFGRYNTNTVGVVDTSLDEMVAVWPASQNPAAKTHAVWITNDGKDLYATNEGATQSSPGTLSKLDARTGELVWEFGIGTRPSEVLVTPNGKTAYVSVRNDNRLRVLDVSARQPGHEWLSANGKYTFIALEASSTSSPGAIGVVDNRTGEVLDTWTYPGGPWPHGVFYEPEVLR